MVWCRILRVNPCLACASNLSMPVLKSTIPALIGTPAHFHLCFNPPCTTILILPVFSLYHTCTDTLSYLYFNPCLTCTSILVLPVLQSSLPWFDSPGRTLAPASWWSQTGRHGPCHGLGHGHARCRDDCAVSLTTDGGGGGGEKDQEEGEVALDWRGGDGGSGCGGGGGGGCCRGCGATVQSARCARSAQTRLHPSWRWQWWWRSRWWRVVTGCGLFFSLCLQHKWQLHRSVSVQTLLHKNPTL